MLITYHVSIKKPDAMMLATKTMNTEENGWVLLVCQLGMTFQPMTGLAVTNFLRSHQRVLNLIFVSLGKGIISI